ncbi:MAG: ankyrin repeat domain-containing protein [Mesorhizobium sp.]
MGPDMIEAARSGDAGELERLIAAGVDVDLRDDADRTALLVATHANNIEAARLLIAAGADVNAKDAIKDTPFLYGGAQGKNEILRMILATGRANLADTNRYGGTALIPAAEKGHPETVRMLIEAGVAIDHVNNLGWTALLEAVMLSDGGPVHQEIVGDLLDAGADWRIADRDGVTPLEHARRRGFHEIVRLIEAKVGG